MDLKCYLGSHLFPNELFPKYNLITIVQVVEVLSKHAGLWITREKEIMYSQATHINFICPMRFDNFPLATKVIYFEFIN